ncbi:MAG: hypothetical protein WCG36_01800 [bacterium]
MPCDICSTSSATHTIAAEAMSRAARKGFNPFHLGMVPPRLARLAGPDFPETWRRQTINGMLAESDWKLCDTCNPKVEPYLAKPLWKSAAIAFSRLFARNAGNQR